MSVREAPQAPVNPLASYQFTPDELRVLKQCNRDSFFQRSVPIGATLGMGVFYAVKNGFIKGHAKWGPTPKVMLAVTVGYFLGKFSYQSKCAEKLMILPNSQLAEILRARRKGGYNESLKLDANFGSTGIALAPFNSQTEVYSDDVPQTRSLDLDTERPDQKGLDETNRLNVDSNTPNDFDAAPLPPSQSNTSYDELRRKNRDDYHNSKTESFRGVVGKDDVPSIIRSPDPPRPTPKVSKNKYGDTWE